ncbi:MAG: peptidoglycan editing factor PgeF [Deltaproteobacteria bacterium]|nr:peptidoglycan editing factor PgeF [Deltaproteobacteria bacterium]
MDASILRASLLSVPGVVHGFTTRIGGVSQGAFSSFNLSEKVGDDHQAVESNRLRLASLLKRPWSEVVGINQVHGDELLVVDGSPEHLPPSRTLAPEEDRRFDGSITNRQDILLAVRTADCLPLLLYAPDKGVVAAVHAGWRGSLSGIAAKAVAAMKREYGCSPGHMLACLGPCIGPQNFEVGEDVFAAFADRFGGEVALEDSRGLYVDLIRANQQHLVDAGLLAEHVESLNLCTHHLAAQFFSHRRDKGKTGRQMAFIGLAPDPSARQDVS